MQSLHGAVHTDHKQPDQSSHDPGDALAPLRTDGLTTGTIGCSHHQHSHTQLQLAGRCQLAPAASGTQTPE